MTFKSSRHRKNAWSRIYVELIIIKYQMYLHIIGSQLNFNIRSKLKKAMNYISLMYQITPTCIPCRKCHNQLGHDNYKDYASNSWKAANYYQQEVEFSIASLIFLTNQVDLKSAPKLLLTIVLLYICYWQERNSILIQWYLVMVREIDW